MADRLGTGQGDSMPQIRWLREALLDFERLHDFIHAKSPEAAARAAQTLLEGVHLLRNSPALGRPMPDESGRRELFLPFGAGAYVLRYHLADSETVVIIRVWHSRENREE